MDWIDEQFIKIRNKVKNQPLLKAAMAYLVFFAGAAMVLTILTV